MCISSALVVATAQSFKSKISVWTPGEILEYNSLKEENEERAVRWCLSDLPMDLSASNLPRTPWSDDLLQIPLLSCHPHPPSPTEALLSTQPHFQVNTGSTLVHLLAFDWILVISSICSPNWHILNAYNSVALFQNLGSEQHTHPYLYEASAVAGRDRQ